MYLRYLDYFLALAKYKNFSEAAAQLYISQSSLSKKIKKLEDILGLTLFLRSSTGVKLTHEGEIYLRYALEIKQLESRCLASLQLKETAPLLQIGCIPSMKEYGVVDLVSSFMNKTGISCKIITKPSGDLESMLMEQDLDLAFVKNPKHLDELNIIPFKKDHLVVIVPKNHPLASLEMISFADLKDEPLILEPENSRPYRLIISLCEQSGFTPEVRYTDHFVENILEFVRQGFGVSLLMSKLVEGHLEGLKAIPVTPDVIASITLCTKKSTPITESMQAFITYTKNI